MKNLSEMLRLFVFNSLLVMLLLSPCVFSATNAPNPALSCPGPEVSITGHTSGSISFGWSSVGTASSYKTWYHRQGDNFWSSQFSTSNTAYTYSGLPSGTYDFYFVTDCGGETSEIVIVIDVYL